MYPGLKKYELVVSVVALRLQRGNPDGDVVTHIFIHFVVLSFAMSTYSSNMTNNLP